MGPCQARKSRRQEGVTANPSIKHGRQSRRGRDLRYRPAPNLSAIEVRGRCVPHRPPYFARRAAVVRFGRRHVGTVMVRGNLAKDARRIQRALHGLSPCPKGSPFEQACSGSPAPRDIARATESRQARSEAEPASPATTPLSGRLGKYNCREDDAMPWAPVTRHLRSTLCATPLRGKEGRQQARARRRGPVIGAAAP
jgi:hypothetical protein